MTFEHLVEQHRLFFVFLVLFLLVAAVDMLNLDRLFYKYICDMLAPVSGSPCPAYYDLPIWQVYLSLGILAGLYHVHSEVRATNRHLAARK